jgi:cell shape-determining protein MreC
MKETELQKLKRENAELKEELELAKLRAENAKLRDEIWRLNHTDSKTITTWTYG